MHRDPHLRIQRVSEDADEDGELRVPDSDYTEPDHEEPRADAPCIEDVDDEGRAMAPGDWVCECGQVNNAEWRDCVLCGADREDVDA
jgi:hypothetical protein